MSSDQRKATDILLEIETKVSEALALAKTNDFNIKILSQKINSLFELLREERAPKPTISAVEEVNKQVLMTPPEKRVFVSSEHNIAINNNPEPLRRTARPDVEPAKSKTILNKAEAVIPSQEITDNSKVHVSNDVMVPISQRVINSQGKTLFLVSIEIFSFDKKEVIYRTRTAAVGTWNAVVGVGKYKITARKLDTATQQKVEVSIDVTVDGSSNPLYLPDLVLKPS